MFALVLAATSGASAYIKIQDEKDPSRAVVLSHEVPVMSGPTDDATLQFEIHEGTLVDVSERRAGWLRIHLPGGLSGWVSAAALETV